MSPLVPIALFGWIPVSLGTFAVLPVRRAAIITFLLGWMFLPVASYGFAGLPDYTKVTAVSLAALLGVVLYGSGRLAEVRLNRLDIPMLFWCGVPALSSLVNGNGPYDAASAVLHRCFEWGIPYLLGRALFRDLDDLNFLAKCLFVAGLCYVPLCLYEIRMSPQLHATIYGFHQHAFGQHVRLGGYRPLVFMHHGLMVGMWMSITTLSGLSLWRYGRLQSLASIPTGFLWMLLFATTIFCKSTGALILLAAGMLALVSSRSLRSRLPVGLLLVAPVIFVAARLGLGWQGEGLIDFLGSISAERASSLDFRIRSEEIFLADVWQRPLLGWSSWGVADPLADTGQSVHATRDSYWLITFMCFGLIGLAAFFALFLVPCLSLLRRFPTWSLADPRTAGALALLTAMGMYVGDNMVNAMLNPVYVVVLGALTSVAIAAAAPADGEPVATGHE